MKLNVLLFSILLSISTTFLMAQTHIFTGNGGTSDWFTAENWDVNSVPQSNSQVNIPDGFFVTISTSEAAVESIELEGTAELELTNNLTITGEMIIPFLGQLTYISGVISGGAIENEGTLRVMQNNAKSCTNLTITNNGLIEVLDTGIWRLNGTTVITNGPEGIFRMKGVGSVIKNSGTAVFYNEGLIQKSLHTAEHAASYLILTIENHGVIRTDENTTLLILSQQAALTNFHNGVIEGNGIYDITAPFVNTGTIAPGGEFVGNLEVVNSFDFPSEAVLEIDIEGAEEGAYDHVYITGFPDLNGTIEVNVSDYLELDDEFTIITTNAISSCNLPAEVYALYDHHYYIFDVDCNTESVTLKVTDIAVLNNQDFLKDAISFTPYPNPANDLFYISLNFSETLLVPETGFTIQLFNSLGQKIHGIEHLSEGITKVERGNLLDGVYLLQLESNNKVIARSKLILY